MIYSPLILILYSYSTHTALRPSCLPMRRYVSGRPEVPLETLESFKRSLASDCSIAPHSLPPRRLSCPPRLDAFSHPERHARHARASGRESPVVIHPKKGGTSTVRALGPAPLRLVQCSFHTPGFDVPPATYAFTAGQSRRRCRSWE
jgi:hypothetical protein